MKEKYKNVKSIEGIIRKLSADASLVREKIEKMWIKNLNEYDKKVMEYNSYLRFRIEKEIDITNKLEKIADET